LKLLILFQQLDEPAGEGLDFLLGELEDYHVPDHYQHLVEDGCPFSLQQLLLLMQVP
jgi:hypothetical protein